MHAIINDFNENLHSIYLFLKNKIIFGDIYCMSSVLNLFEFNKCSFLLSDIQDLKVKHKYSISSILKNEKITDNTK